MARQWRVMRTAARVLGAPVAGGEREMLSLGCLAVSERYDGDGAALLRHACPHNLVGSSRSAKLRATGSMAGARSNGRTGNDLAPNT
jgi:hypothetical protein